METELKQQGDRVLAKHEKKKKTPSNYK